MLIRYYLTFFCLISVILPSLAQDDAETERVGRSGDGVSISIGLNTFPQEIIGMVEYMSKSRFSYFAGLDYGNQREFDQNTIGVDDDNCFVRPLLDTVNTFEAYGDISTGIGYDLSRGHNGLYLQAGVFTRLGGQTTFSEHDGAISHGALFRVNYKRTIAKNLFVLIGSEVNFLVVDRLNCELTDSPVFDLDLFLIRVGYTFN